jgi:drug/metabolite transporter (DMT)-like permease
LNVSEDSNNTKLYYVLAFGVLAAYGSYGVFVRWTGLEGSEQYIVFWRTIIGIVPIALVIVFSGKLHQLNARGHYLLLAASGAVVALQSYSGSKAINLLSVSDALFIIYLAPVLVAVFAPLILKEKLERSTIMALAIALGGLAFISFAGRGAGSKQLNLEGMGFAVLSAFSYAALILTLKILRESVPALIVYFYQSIVILLVMLPFVWSGVPAVTNKGWASLLVLGLFHSAFLGMAYITVVKRVKAQHMGVLSYIDPVSSTLFAWALLGETPGWQNFVGGALIIAAGCIVLFRGAPSPEELHE